MRKIAFHRNRQLKICLSAEEIHRTRMIPSSCLRDLQYFPMISRQPKNFTKASRLVGVPMNLSKLVFSWKHPYTFSQKKESNRGLKKWWEDIEVGSDQKDPGYLVYIWDFTTIYIYHVYIYIRIVISQFFWIPINYKPIRIQRNVKKGFDHQGAWPCFGDLAVASVHFCRTWETKANRVFSSTTTP